MERLPEFISNHLFLVSLFISLLMLLIWNLYGGVLSGAKQIIPAELTRLINRESAVVIDVRSEDDYKNNHILHAINMPDKELEANSPKLDKYKKQALIVYCANGADSTRVARTLATNGFEQVYCLKGGLPSWQNANLPLTKET
ncbi:MAG: rhodanese-like domain-containing protein [Gammaproteobacteria bacterium]|jgi:rhodanese-related sulfurtransferase|nr:rhodanese-like domain-containing protein [Gammaproteobacteria bacterium]